MGNSTCKIDHGKQCENKCLDKGNKETEEHEDNRYQEWNEGEEYGGNQMVTGYVAEEPYAQGHGSCDVADELDGAHQDAEDNVGVPRHHVADEDELPQVLDPVLPQPVIMGEDEHRERTGKGRVHIVRRGKEAGDETGKVIEENEKGQCADEEHELGSPFTHVLLDEVGDGLDDELDEVPEGELLVGNNLVFQFFHLPVTKKNDEKKKDRNNDRI